MFHAFLMAIASMFMLPFLALWSGLYWLVPRAIAGVVMFVFCLGMAVAIVGAGAVLFVMFLYDIWRARMNAWMKFNSAP